MKLKRRNSVTQRGSSNESAMKVLKVWLHNYYTLQWNPLYKGHLGIRLFILYIHVERFKRYEVLHLGPINLSIIWRLFLLCPLYGVSIKRGYTVIVITNDGGVYLLQGLVDIADYKSSSNTGQDDVVSCWIDK